MSWIAEAFHVARKDIHGARWLAGISVFLTAAATVSSAELFGPVQSTFNYWALLSGAASAFFVAQVVQLDSPARGDAFWVSRPLRPGAVLFAKVICGSAIVAIGLVGQGVALIAHNFAAAEVFISLLYAGLLHASLLASLAVLAALTPNLRVFTVVAFAAFIALQYASGLFRSDPISFPEDAAVAGSWPGAGLLVATSIVVLAVQYITRRRLVGGVLFGLSVLVPLATARLETTWPPGPASTGIAIPADVPTRLRITSYEVDAERDGRASRIHVHFALPPGTTADTAYQLNNGRLYFEAAGGSRQRVQHSPAPLTFISRLDRAPRGTRWYGLATYGIEISRLQAEITREQAEQLRRGEIRPIVRGTLSLMESRQLARLPLRDGATARAPGHRFRILEVGTGAFEDAVRLRTSSVWRPAQQPRGFTPSFRFTPDEPRYSLVNPSQGNAVPLNGGSSGSGGTLPLLSPGASASLRTMSVREHATGNRRPPIDSAWFAGAVLDISAWVEVASFRIEARTDSATTVSR